MAQHENKQSLLKVEEVTLDSGGSATFQGSFHTRLKEIAYITGLPKNIVPASVRIPSFGGYSNHRWINPPRKFSGTKFGYGQNLSQWKCD
jgi:hypothetical protein